jgi:hypothetical protein
VLYWTCTGKDPPRHHRGHPGTGQKIKKEEVRNMKVMFQYARYALSTLATVAFGTGFAL